MVKNGDKAYVKSEETFQLSDYYFIGEGRNVSYYNFENIFHISENDFLNADTRIVFFGQSQDFVVHAKSYRVKLNSISSSSGGVKKAKLEVYKLDANGNQIPIIYSTGSEIEISPGTANLLKDGTYVILESINEPNAKISIGEGRISSGIPKPTLVEGKYEKAISLDGIDDCIKTGIKSPEIPSDFSISVWVKSKKGDAYARILEFPGVELRKQDDSSESRFAFTVTDSNEQSSVIYTSATEEWTHLLAVKEGKRISLYKNGVLVRSKDELTTERIKPSADPNEISIGCRYGGKTTNKWYGLIDELKIYYGAVSAKEARDIYENRKIQIRPLVGYSFSSSTTGRINLWDANGKLYVYNPNDNIWYDRTSEKVSMGLPADFKPVVGYPYPYSPTDSRVYLFDSNGGFYFYSSATRTWRDITSSKANLGLPVSGTPTLGYYDDIDKKTILWYDNQIYVKENAENSKFVLLQRPVESECSATKPCPTGKICTNGQCVNPPIQGSCTDSDLELGGTTGMAFYTSGSTTYNLADSSVIETKKDECIDTTILKEYGCNGNILIETTHTCPYNCVPKTDTLGAKCGGVPAITCSDSDAGRDKNNLGIVITKFDGAETRYEDDCDTKYNVKEYYCDSHKHIASVILTCGTGKKCERGRCIALGKECDEDIDCPGRQEVICDKGLCISGCRSDYDCRAGRECKNKLCVLKQECTKDRECASNEICNENGECEIKLTPVVCTADEECEKGEVCKNGKCNKIISLELILIIALIFLALSIGTTALIIYLVLKSKKKAEAKERHKVKLKPADKKKK